MQKVQQKYIDIACKANFFLPYLRQAAKIYVSTSYSVVRQETIEISEQRTAFVWFFAQEVDWCMINCDKQRLQTSVSINLWKILAGHTGDWFDVKTASICTTELWDALKSFILTILKFKVAPYPIIVSLDTLSVFHGRWTWFESMMKWRRNLFQWWFLLGNHNHQANPHVHQQHVVLAKTICCWWTCGFAWWRRIFCAFFTF